ncbi:hypothetical protein HRR83_004934 [Exophiala dermatitidis]|uniref:DNA-binding protein RAP1 n=2 Tax=Exophiala dermatitidis TaxID=5970 RepID=H6C3J1_EXODN|nr:telomeric repeat-binding factor 2-interacting protein 1 [Exophiala dermatitidis NIH/UT8656]KAJ4513901.1 hypothetical protein HRR75_004482 [Exophiala dermatitidis]EHY58206.1 telomeric repeat-binding factor 2-interacting protein 1 [Exophiala dermatitidis NIH/UT8656]KAJ4517151.1 hypothetical protein HRR74_004901 [Exophiala dermatitidis]KAJ4519671.1 hypothetical protein HRR73_003731 [Exophiala dermatitidis]KAJ4534529.1 hypothetical protein HRR76_006451 [Exophiala dermatitidis]
MSGHIVYDGVSRTAQDDEHDDHRLPQLFAGQKLWFHHQIPQRKWLIDNAKLYGATVVDLDKHADIKLVDHAKKNNAPGTHSYRYVELSIRKGRLENLADHAVGASTRAGRAVGSTVTAPRSIRVNYTPEDDQFLWNWLKPFEDSGGPVSGTEIYRQVEQANPRHTWQSWRERWLKHTRFQKRQITSSTPQTQEQTEEQPQESPVQPQPRKRRRDPEDEGDLEASHRNQARQQRAPSSSFKLATLPEVEANVKPVEKLDAPRPSQQKSKRPFQQSATTSDADRSSFSLPDNRSSIFRTSFSRDDYRQLYFLVPKLTDITLDAFHSTWEKLAASEDYNHHTAEEWKLFWTTRVIPDYCRKNGLWIEEVAPYLLRRSKEGSTTISHSQETEQFTSSAPRKVNESRTIVCSNCFTTESNKWCVNKSKEGEYLCNPCAVFLRRHGVPRPSTVRLTVEGEDEATPHQSQAKASSAAAPRQPELRLASPAPTYAKRPVQSFLSNQEEARIDHQTPPRCLDPDPRPESPSFQPESPTLMRRPEPNEARKRTGRESQSQSTQGSNKPTSQIDSKTASVLPVGATMGQTGSREAGTKFARMRKDPSPEWRVASNVQPPLKGPGEKSSLSYDPRKVGSGDAFSSTGTDRASSSHHVEDPFSEYDAKPTPQELDALDKSTGNVDRDTSPLFVPEEGAEDSNPEYERKNVQVTTAEVNHSFPSNVADDPSDHVSQFMSENLSDPVQSMMPTEQYETGQQSLEAWETAPQSQRLQSMPPTKTQGALEIPETADDGIASDFDLPEPEGGWDKFLADVPPDADNEATNSELSDISNAASSAPVEGAARASTKSEFQLNELESLPPPPPDFLPTQADGTTDEDDEARKIDEWISQQKSLYPNIHRLEAVLFKALESTTFDLGLSSEVVRLILRELRKRGLRGGPNVIVEEEIVLPQNMKGVWTEEDDNLLLSTNSTDIERVLSKHGREGASARFDFLEKVAED